MNQGFYILQFLMLLPFSIAQILQTSFYRWNDFQSLSKTNLRIQVYILHITWICLKTVSSQFYVLFVIFQYLFKIRAAVHSIVPYRMTVSFFGFGLAPCYCSVSQNFGTRFAFWNRRYAVTLPKVLVKQTTCSQNKCLLNFYVYKSCAEKLKGS